MFIVCFTFNFQGVPLERSWNLFWPKVGFKASPQELPGEPLGSPWGDLESPCDTLGRLWEGFGHLVGLLGTPGEPFCRPSGAFWGPGEAFFGSF